MPIMANVECITADYCNRDSSPFQSIVEGIPTRGFGIHRIEEAHWFLAERDGINALQNMVGVCTIILGIAAAEIELGRQVCGAQYADTIDTNTGKTTGALLMLSSRLRLRSPNPGLFAYIADQTNSVLDNVGSPLRLERPS